MELTGKDYILTKMLEISKKFERGNKKSKRIGSMFEKVANIFAHDEYQFEMMIRSMEEGNRRMSDKYNRDFFDAVGGKRGSGEFLELDIEDSSNKTGKDLQGILDGIDPDGFNHLQTMIPFTTAIIKGIVPIKSPNDLPSFNFMMNHINLVFWNILFSVFYDEYAKELDEIFNRYNPGNVNLN